VLGAISALALLVAPFASLLFVAPASAQAVQVEVGAALTPSTLTVPAGASVIWRVVDGQRHRIRSESDQPRFESSDLHGGDVYSFTFPAPGTYNYRDDRTGARGTIVVTGGAATANPTATATAPPGGATAPASASVSMANRAFSPGNVSIAAGGTVTWTNNDGASHTATANDRSWDSGILRQGGTFSRTFPTAGAFSYLCELHPEMTGTVTVSGTPSATATPSPTATATPTATSTATPSPTATASAAPTAAATTPATAAAAAANVAAGIVDNAFAPAALAISAGDTVIWTNNGRALHTVTADDASFDSGMLRAGQSFAHRFDRPGSLRFTCIVHPEMVGMLTVAAAGTTPPASVVPPATATRNQPVTGAAGGPTRASGAAAPAATPAAPPTDPAVVEADMLDFRFDPEELRVTTGSTVRWTNRGRAPHSVAAEDGSFASTLFDSGGVYEVTFAQAGTFNYVCGLHPNMRGVVIVTDPDAPGAAAGAQRSAATDRDVAGAPAGGAGAAGRTSVLAAIGLLLATAALTLVGRRPRAQYRQPGT
jgi:plastocyanin